MRAGEWRPGRPDESGADRRPESNTGPRTRWLQAAGRPFETSLRRPCHEAGATPGRSALGGAFLLGLGSHFLHRGLELAAVAGGLFADAGGLAGQAAQIIELGPAHIAAAHHRSEEHTSELQSLLRNSYAV